MAYDTITTVADLDTSDNGFMFVSDTQDVMAVRSYGYDTDGEYNSYFVMLRDGEYIAVYGMYGIIPDTYKTLYLL